MEAISGRHETSTRKARDGIDDSTCDRPPWGNRPVAGRDGPHGFGPWDLRRRTRLGLLRPRDRPRCRGGRIEGLHGALARRASGLTWMIWGIVAPAIFISYALLGILVGFPGNGNGYHALSVLFPVLWAPWAAIGLVATATLWRSVGLVIPRRSAQMREGLLTGAIIVGIIFAGFAAIAVTKVPVVEFAWVLMAQGIGVVTVGLMGFNCNDATERRLRILRGILFVAAALAGSLLLRGEILLACQ